MFKQGQRVFMFWHNRYTGLKLYRYGVIDKNQPIDGDTVDVRFDDTPEKVENLFYGFLYDEAEKPRCEAS